MTMMENARKQVFHVVTLLTLTVVCASTLLSLFTLGVQVKILKDLCMTSILFCGGVLAVALASTAVPAEMESKTCYPILARSVRRSQFIVGKYLGTLATIYLGLLFIGGAFTILLLSRQAFDAMMLIAIGYAFLEVAVVGAIAIALSTCTTPAVAAMVSFLLYVAGTVKMGYLKPLVDGVQNPAAKALVLAFYHLLPNLESFNFKDALVHSIPVPGSYLVQVAIYGVCYASLVILVASSVFARKEL
jgi:ABC-type transport system involved in multi-copper enzyme maturation permease subunit